METLLGVTFVLTLLNSGLLGRAAYRRRVIRLRTIAASQRLIAASRD